MPRALDAPPARPSRQPWTWLRQWSRAATDLVFPPVCTFCGEPGAPQADGALLCDPCVRQLEATTSSCCDACGLPCPAISSPDGKCADCRPRRFAFDGVRTLGIYGKDVRNAVLRMKHHSQESLAIALGRRLGGRVASQPFSETPDLIAPIPMHWVSRLLRGTSAAQTLAQSAATVLGIPCADDLLHCRRMLRRQASLPAGERLLNVRGAFGISRGFDIRGLRILLVDDVVTTGATCDSAARALRRAGAERVFVLAVARGTGVSS